MKILCVLYDDPKKGMPKSYPVTSLPKLDKYPDGMKLPSPSKIDFKPGQLLGCVSGELGLRKFLESKGHTLVVTSDKDAKGCKFDSKRICQRRHFNGNESKDSSSLGRKFCNI